ncbi:nucleotidyl transferase AbiEii/AbiGii toxin family protein [Patescibacteria group bacterium]|nr:nucleotidyl transferase AbiEii/AbiGii toxin family protein [Patescibacteria group bacterium]
MIDSITLQGYAKKYKMDRFTVLREYLQIVFLNNFFKLSKPSEIFFKGGTALRLMYDSPRFSEDLDFNTTLKKENLLDLVAKAVTESKKVLPGLNSRELKTLQGYSAKLYFPTEIAPMPLTVKLDFSEREKTIQKMERTISTELPVQNYSVIVAMSMQEILAEKFRTIFQRDKGRDLYDIWYMLNKKVPVNIDLVNTKMKLIDKKFKIEEIEARIAGFETSILKKDTFKFLPLDQRGIVAKLPELILEKLKEADFIP